MRAERDSRELRREERNKYSLFVFLTVQKVLSVKHLVQLQMYFWKMLNLHFFNVSARKAVMTRLRVPGAQAKCVQVLCSHNKK